MSKTSDMYEQINQQQYLLVRTKLEEAINAITNGKELSKKEEQDYYFSGEDIKTLRSLLDKNGLSYHDVIDYDDGEAMFVMRVNNQFIKILADRSFIPSILSLDDIKEELYRFFVGDIEEMSKEEIEEELEFREIDIEEELRELTALPNIDLDSIAITSSDSKEQQAFGDEPIEVYETKEDLIIAKLKQSIQDSVDGKNQTITYQDNEIYTLLSSLEKAGFQKGIDFYFEEIPIDEEAQETVAPELSIRIGDNLFEFTGTYTVAIRKTIQDLNKFLHELIDDIGEIGEDARKYYFGLSKLKPIDLEKLGIRIDNIERLKKSINVNEELDMDNDETLDIYTGYSFEEFIQETKQLFKRPIMVMGDSSSMSVQASAFHYCEPRRSGLDSYKSYEVSYPSQIIEQLRDYLEMPVESDEELLESVYANVPAEVLSKIVMEHGGVDKEATLHPEKKLDGYKQEKAEMDNKTRKAQEMLNQMTAQLGNVLEDDGKDNK